MQEFSDALARCAQAFPESGRSDRQNLIEFRVRFRPEADVESKVDPHTMKSVYEGARTAVSTTFRGSAVSIPQ